MAPKEEQAVRPGKPNRLAHEKSPYLLQHADNPVDWYPWGEEAFQKAKREGKPVFLSVGYSTCHWCHVMERESFENPEVAQVLNEHFVSVKVDREERPDIDQVYMAFVMAATGSGGWPMTVFLTPEKAPFFGGTYFPPVDAWGRPGLKSVLLQVAVAWKEKRQELLQSSESIAGTLRERGAVSSQTGSFSPELFAEGIRQYAAQFDAASGGFGTAPKFPRSHSLSFLLRAFRRTSDERALRMVETTLTEMAKGGVYDQLGGGFHRYATDAKWRIPHFEKMLYDQALLAKTYLEAYQVTGNEVYADIARGTLDYVLRDLKGPEGGFYSAEDADSVAEAAHPEEKSEGAFYLWSDVEILKHLGKEDGTVFLYAYGIEPDGNAFSDPQGELAGKNVLYQARTVEETARTFGRKRTEVEDILERGRKTLFEARSKRPRPHLDDKVLVDWNGLMISALSFGSRILKEPRYGEAAKQAADFILKHLVRRDGRLLHRYRDGDAAILATLDDHAFFIQGLLDLYEATFDVAYLEQAKRLSEAMLRLFGEEREGGLFLTGSDAEKLLFRPREFYDGAIPSGNGVAALDLLRLSRITLAHPFEEKAAALLRAVSPQLTQSPIHYPQTLMAVDFALGPSPEVVIAGKSGDPTVSAMVDAVYRRFLPNHVLLLHPPASDGKRIESLAPPIAAQGMQEGRTTAYVCQNFTCQLPVTDPGALGMLLDR